MAPIDWIAARLSSNSIRHASGARVPAQICRLNGMPPQRIGNGHEQPHHFFLFANPDEEYGPVGRRVMFPNDLEGHKAAWDFLELQAREQDLGIERPKSVKGLKSNRKIRAALRCFFASHTGQNDQGHQGYRSRGRTTVYAPGAFRPYEKTPARRASTSSTPSTPSTPSSGPFTPSTPSSPSSSMSSFHQSVVERLQEYLKEMGVDGGEY